MEIKYNSKSLKLGFILGIAFLLVGITSVIFSETPSIFFLVVGITYIIIGIYRSKGNYIIIKDGYLKKDFGGKIFLKDVTEIKRFAGDYIFKTTQTQVTIDTNVVDKKSLAQLEEFVINFEIKSQ
jgi:hypothetical protein